MSLKEEIIQKIKNIQNWARPNYARAHNNHIWRSKIKWTIL